MSVRQPLQGYEILKLIGSGSFGLVYLAQDLKNQTLCAIKEFPVSPKTAQHFFRELSLLFTLDHP
ncbi:MAG TPA: serine/threonine protein kinase, partial [Acidobacteriota bacterium]|nr:serine/threonine protein kinase [Acidobacteriota bacterium]